MEDADKTNHSTRSPSPRDGAAAPLPKSQEAEIPAKIKEICERYGEDVIGMMLASGLNPRAQDLRAIYATDETIAHATAWHTERSRSRQRRERITFSLEIAVVLLILGEILLGLWQGHLQSRNFNEQQQVLTNLQTSSAATAKTLTSLQSATESMNAILQMQLDAAKKSAVQAERSANAGEASASTSSQALHVSERAYVNIISSLLKPPSAGEKLQYSVVLSNSGRTPALETIARLSGTVALSSMSVSEVHAMVTKAGLLLPSQSDSVGTLSPGPGAEQHTDSPITLTQPDFDQIIEGKALIYIFATASYKDIFGQPHHTEICAFYTPLSKSFATCHEFNKSD
jgi:hypothetical protein